jgi:hypothetical protein
MIVKTVTLTPPNYKDTNRIEYSEQAVTKPLPKYLWTQTGAKFGTVIQPTSNIPAPEKRPVLKQP